MPRRFRQIRSLRCPQPRNNWRPPFRRSRLISSRLRVRTRRTRHRGRSSRRCNLRLRLRPLHLRRPLHLLHRRLRVAAVTVVLAVAGRVRAVGVSRLRLLPQSLRLSRPRLRAAAMATAVAGRAAETSPLAQHRPRQSFPQLLPRRPSPAPAMAETAGTAAWASKEAAAYPARYRPRNPLQAVYPAHCLRLRTPCHRHRSGLPTPCRTRRFSP